MRGLLSYAVLALSACAAASATHHKHHGEHHGETYDYIIAGGGLAGLVVAEKIAYHTRHTVLVLEAGPDPTGNPLVSTPALAASQIGTPLDWNYTTTPQPTLDGESIPFQQGRMLGGGSGANYMAYCRGSPSVYDEWARLSGDAGWKWDRLFHYFRRGANMTSTKTNVRVAGNPSEGFSRGGNLQVSYPKVQYNFGPYWHDAWEKDQVQPLAAVDKSVGEGIGVTYTQFTINPTNATRSYSLTAYGYGAQVLKNAKVQPNAWVKKVQFRGKTARGVEYVDEYGKTHEVHARREVILSAGAFGTPKLLLLSGIGPKDQLKKHGIPVVHDARDVGKHLQDHLFSTIEIEVTSNITTANDFSDPAKAGAYQADYVANAQGPFAVSLASAYANDRIPHAEAKKLGANYANTLPADRPTYQYDAVAAPIVAGTQAASAGKSVISFFVANVQPEARGCVKLASADYRDQPLIDSKVYGTENDRATILYGYKRMRSILRSETFKPIYVSEVFPGDHVQSDEDLFAAIKKSAATYHHPMGTASMGKVTDGHLRVRGVHGLRVVDSSAVPHIPTCYPQAAIYALAQRASDLIIGRD